MAEFSKSAEGPTENRFRLPHRQDPFHDQANMDPQKVLTHPLQIDPINLIVDRINLHLRVVNRRRALRTHLKGWESQFLKTLRSRIISVLWVFIEEAVGLTLPF